MELFNIQQILQLCNKINMPFQMIDKIKENYNLINQAEIETYFFDLLNFEKASKSYEQLQQYTSKLDEDKVCELIILLGVATKTYDKYIEKGISEEIYIDTMKCFSRFVIETYKWTGKYDFDRGFWVWRQLCLILFRIGTLEFEILNIDDNIAKKFDIKESQVLSVHIPNDAICSNEYLKSSYKMAFDFFKQYFNKEYKFICSSWLLGQELDYLIKKDSGIYNFRKDYKIVEYTESNDYLQWVFNKFQGNIEDFIPKTSLQMAIKEHIMSGKKMTIGLGKLEK